MKLVFEIWILKNSVNSALVFLVAYVKMLNEKRIKKVLINDVCESVC